MHGPPGWLWVECVAWGQHSAPSGRIPDVGHATDAPRLKAQCLSNDLAQSFWREAWIVSLQVFQYSFQEDSIGAPRAVPRCNQRGEDCSLKTFTALSPHGLRIDSDGRQDPL